MRRLLALCFGATLAFAAAPYAAGAAESLKIGVGAPLRGADAIFGNQLKVGVEQAIADINANGGFLQRKGRAIPGDDASDPKKGVEVAKSFVKSGIDLVVGHFSSAVTMPASVVYADAGALEITPSAFGAQITDRGLATLFRTCGREDQQAAVATSFLLARHFAKVAVLHDRTTTGKALADTVRKMLTERGVADVFYGSFAEGSRDISGLLGRLRQSGAQIVFWGGGPSGAAAVVKQLSDMDASIPLLGGLALASDDFANGAGGAADGSFSIFARDPRRQPAAADLLRKLKSKKADTGGYVFYAYAAVQIIRQAADIAQSLDPKALAATMHSGRTFDTVLGPIAFDEKGDPKATDLTVYVWHRGPTGRMGFWDEAGS